MHSAWQAAGRIGLAAVLGAALGWGISADLDWSATSSDRECAHVSGLCFGTAPFAGLAIGVIAGVGACWLGLAVARLRPLSVTVPLGAMLLLLTVWGYLDAVPGGRLHPRWGFALVTGLVFALPAIATSTFGKRR
jgi:hypothetical protein